MDKKQELTENLKVAELEANNIKRDINTLQYKLKSSYEYEEALNNRLVEAKKKTEELRKQMIEKKSRTPYML